MLQSAIFSDLQVNNFSIPSLRSATPVPRPRQARGRLAALLGWFYDAREPVDLQRLSPSLRRDIGLRV